MTTSTSASPDWLICLECEAPCYVFEYRDGEILEAICTTCGNEDPEFFMSPGDFDELQDSL